MAGVQDVETAIGEDDLLALGAGILDRGEQLLDGHHAALGAFLALHRAAQLRRADAGGAQLADHDPGGQVGQCHGLWQFLAGRDRSGQRRDDGIAGTGDIEHFTGTSRQVQRRVIGTQQGHAVLATGDQQRIQLEPAHQLGALGDQFGLIGAMPDDCLEFAQVRRDQRGTAVDVEVLALGVG